MAYYQAIGTALQAGLLLVGVVTGIAIPMSATCAGLSLAAKIPIGYLAGSVVGGGGLALADTMLAMYDVDLMLGSLSVSSVQRHVPIG